MTSKSLLLFTALAALASLSCSSSDQQGTGTEIEDLDAECTIKINALWLKYTESSGVPGCDQACLTQCYSILQDAIWATKNKNCPVQSDIQRCFHVYSDDWEDYVKECELFAFEDGSEGDGEGESSSESESSSENESNSEAAASSQGRRRLLSEAEALGVAGEGCFPVFGDAEDFEKYIDGEWEYSSSSNAAGIALSVVFFVGLVGLALFLKS